MDTERAPRGSGVPFPLPGRLAYRPFGSRRGWRTGRMGGAGIWRGGGKERWGCGVRGFCRLPPLLDARVRIRDLLVRRERGTEVPSLSCRVGWTGPES